jgi:hypothetical protein
VYGSMFAPNQEQAARELLRVCRPGGKIGMANWTPEGFWGQAFGLTARYRPPPPGVRSPLEWGTEKRLRELFGSAVESMQVSPRSALFRYRSVAHWMEVFSHFFGPVMKTLEVLDEARRSAYREELAATLRRFNQSGDDTLMVSADYLEIVLVKSR